MKIIVRNRQKKVPFSLRPLQAIARRALGVCLSLPRKSGAVLSNLPGVEVTIISDEEMAALHQRFMDIAGATDVLTFEHGEIIIGAETALANAAGYGVAVEQELALYIVHGLLHLLGFDDRSAAGSKEMRRMESAVLSRSNASKIPSVSITKTSE